MRCMRQQNLKMGSSIIELLPDVTNYRARRCLSRMTFFFISELGLKGDQWKTIDCTVTKLINPQAQQLPK